MRNKKKNEAGRGGEAEDPLATDERGNLRSLAAETSRYGEPYKRDIWLAIRALRDGDGSAPVPDWMIGRSRCLVAWSLGRNYVVYDSKRTNRPLSYGDEGDIDFALHGLVRVELDSTVFARSRRKPFPSGEGALRALPLSGALALIRERRAYEAGRAAGLPPEKNPEPKHDG